MTYMLLCSYFLSACLCEGNCIIFDKFDAQEVFVIRFYNLKDLYFYTTFVLQEQLVLLGSWRRRFQQIYWEIEEMSWKMVILEQFPLPVTGSCFYLHIRGSILWYLSKYCHFYNFLTACMMLLFRSCCHSPHTHRVTEY